VAANSPAHVEADVARIRVRVPQDSQLRPIDQLIRALEVAEEHAERVGRDVGDVFPNHDRVAEQTVRLAGDQALRVDVRFVVSFSLRTAAIVSEFMAKVPFAR
jgi:hypothetical protein